MELLEKLNKNIHELFELNEKQHELLLKLLSALMVKEYKIKNPDAKSVILASYYLKDLKTKAIAKRPTYECVDPKDHQRINRLQKKYFSQYCKLELKSFNLNHIKIDSNDKMLALIQF